MVFPTLYKHRLKATFFASPPKVLENVDGWKRAHADGHEIGNGSLLGVSDDGRLPNWTPRMVEQDLHMTQEFLSDLTGDEPTSFAYPGSDPTCAAGNYRPTVDERFAFARSGETGVNGLDADLQFLKFLDAPAWSAIEFDEWRRSFLANLESEKVEPSWTILRFGKLFDGTSNHQLIIHELICTLLSAEAERLWIGPLSEIAQGLSQHHRSKVS